MDDSEETQGSDPIDETPESDGAFVAEEPEGELPEDDGGQGGEPIEGQPAPPAEEAPTLEQLQERIREKESQAHGLTIALQQARVREKVAKQRFYQVIDKALEVTGGAPEEEREQEIDPNDPVAELRAGVKDIRDRLSMQEQREAEEQVVAHTQNALDWVANDTEALIAQVPEYPDAAMHVANSIRQAIYAKLRYEFPDADEYTVRDAMEEQFERDVAKIQVAHMKSGKSYARAVLDMARGMGWRGAPAPAPAQNGRRRPSSLDQARAARAGNMSLSHVPSAPGRKQPSRKDLLEMEDDEFSDLIESKALNLKQLAAALAGNARS